MDEELDDDLKKLPEKLEHGLSKEEQIWFANWFTEITKIQQEQTKILRTISKAIQIVAVIVLVSAVLAACQALGL